MAGTWDEPLSLGAAVMLRETGDAMLFEVEEGEEVWIPKSCLHEDSELDDGSQPLDEGELIVREWWAERNGYA